MNKIAAELNNFDPKKLKKSTTVVKKRVDYSQVDLGRPTVDDIDRNTVPRFELEDAAWRDYFEENGYVVIANVLSEEQIEHAKDLLLSWLEEISNFDRNDVTTWDDEDFPASTSTGICSRYGIGQSDFQWYMRTRPKVKASFAKLWDTDDLLSSFDGCGIFRPWLYNQDWKTSGGWFHVDQSTKSKGGVGFQCTQGLINLFDCDDTTGGLTVKPKTHKHHTELCERSRMHSGHYVSIDRRDPLLNMGPAQLVVCKAGDLCLWDSRTIHCNSPGVREPEKPENWSLIRIASYICMTPRAKASREVLKQRKKAYEDHIGTSHWPHYFAKLNTSRHANRKMPMNEDIEWLIGMRDEKCMLM